MKDIYYIGFYDVLENGTMQRNYSLAAAKKIDFVTTTIKDLGYNVHIISPIGVCRNYRSYCNSVTKKIKDGIDVTFPSSWYGRNKISTFVLRIWLQLWLFGYLLKHCHKDDIVFIYHNYVMALPIWFAYKINKFQVILEIEEQFSKIWDIGWINKIKENLMLSLKSEHSLVVSEVLAESLGIKHPIISYGGYQPIIPLCLKGTNRKDKLLIYTGLIDKVRMSAYLAIRSMLYLPIEYMLKISGPITKGEEDYFFHMIEEVNNIKGFTQIEYLGILDNDKYEKLLDEANIALNPQQNGVFSKFLFPSKIITYLSHGLPVVSTKGKSIVESNLADIITFAEDFTEVAIAKAILYVKNEDKNSYVKRIKELSDKFYQELGDLLASLN